MKIEKLIKVLEKQKNNEECKLDKKQTNEIIRYLKMLIKYHKSLVLAIDDIFQYRLDSGDLIGFCYDCEHYKSNENNDCLGVYCKESMLNKYFIDACASENQFNFPEPEQVGEEPTEENNIVGE